MIKKSAGVIFVFFLLTLFVACSSTKNVSSSGVVFTDGFYTTTTSNGIPVIIKQTLSSEPEAAVALVVFHDVSTITTADFEKEQTCLQFVQDQIHTIAAQTTPYVKSEYDYSLLMAHTSLEHISDDLFDIASCFLYPSFSSVHENSAKRHPMNPPPFPRLPEQALQTVIQDVYREHPYAFKSTIAPAQIVDYQEFYNTQILNPEKLAVVLCGAFNGVQAAQLVMTVERLFKDVQPSGTKQNTRSFENKDIVPPKIQATDTVFTLVNHAPGPKTPLPDERYIYATFSVPQYTDDDYLPFAFATMYLNDMFHMTLVERNMMAKSAGVGLIGGKAITGILAINQCVERDLTNAKEQISACIADFPEVSEIETLLPEYKRDFMFHLVRANDSVDAECNKIIESMCFLGSPSAYTTRVQKVNEVTALQIKKAADTYLCADKMHWYMAQ